MIPNRLKRKTSSNEGMALVLVLVVLALLGTMVTEFVYGVYTNTTFLYNWRASKQLSFAAKSGVVLGSGAVKLFLQQFQYTPGVYNAPVADPFTVSLSDAMSLATSDVSNATSADISDQVSAVSNSTTSEEEEKRLEAEEGTLKLVVAAKFEDESAKFNINSIVNEDGSRNVKWFDLFSRLLKNLSIDPALAENFENWLSRDKATTLSPQGGAKVSQLDTLDEMLLVPGIDKAIYDKLLPYVTIYSELRGSVQINVNGAGLPLLMAVDERISEDMAQRIIDYRETTPLTAKNGLDKVPGFQNIATSLAGIFIYQGKFFRITSIASTESGVQRSVECVIDKDGRVKYWRET